MSLSGPGHTCTSCRGSSWFVRVVLYILIYIRITLSSTGLRSERRVGGGGLDLHATWGSGDRRPGCLHKHMAFICVHLDLRFVGLWEVVVCAQRLVSGSPSSPAHDHAAVPEEKNCFLCQTVLSVFLSETNQVLNWAQLCIFVQWAF